MTPRSSPSIASQVHLMSADDAACEQVDKQMSMRTEDDTSLTKRLRSVMSLMWQRTTRRCGAQRASSVHLHTAGQKYHMRLTTCDMSAVKGGTSLEQRRVEGKHQCTACEAETPCGKP